MELGKEIIKAMQIMINRKLDDFKADRTYKSVIKKITSKGYVILDNTGSERTVCCCIPGIELSVGQSVWVKEPMGDLKEIMIVGVIGKAGNSGRRK